ncbi:MAG: outer membrane protein assembly factor BamB family protein [Phycisphaerales bacterium]
MPAPGGVPGARGQLIAPAGTTDAPPAGGPALDTNGDVDALMSKARQFAESANYRNTLLLLNHIVEKYPDVLTEASEGLYVPAKTAVERMIRELPAEALAMYRLDADGVLRGKLGGEPMGCRDEKALEDVAAHLFLADGGDQAAYMLACIRIDEGRWFDARRLLLHIEQDYPDPKVDAAGLQRRLAYAAIRCGDWTTARQAMAKLRGMGAEATWLADALAAAEKAGAAAAHDGADDLLMDAGVGEGAKWVALWRQDTPVRVSAESADVMVMQGQSVQTAGQLRKQWVSRHWLPTSQAVVSGERVYYKLGEVSRCVEVGTGRVLWSSEPDEGNTVRAFGGFNFGSADWPNSPSERLFFVERIGRMVSVADGTVYQIVGDRPSSGPGFGQMVMVVNGQPVQRGIGNALVAMDAGTGAMKWRVTLASRVDAKTAAQAPLPTTRFLTTPVGFETGQAGGGRGLLAVYTDEDELRMAALSAADGSVLWNRYLCSTSNGYAPPGAPVAIAVRDGMAYVVSGHGVVFAVDARDGVIVWASSYRRDTPDQTAGNAPFGRTDMGWLRDPNWQDNVIELTGERLVTAAADAEGVQVFDRRTGRWMKDQTFADKAADAANGNLNYVVGRRGERLYLGGTKTLACFDVNDGRLLWRTYLEGASGRAALGDGAIFAPSGGGIVRIDPISGKWVSRAEIAGVTGGGNRPIGNLFSDGRALVSVGMEEASVLADAGKAMAWLGRGIDGGRSELLLTRAGLRAQMDQRQEAMADLRLAHDRIADEKLKRQAGDTLLGLLLAEIKREPGKAPAMIDEAAALAGEPRQRTRVTLAKADWLAAQGDVAGAIALDWPVVGGKAELTAIDAEDADWHVDPAAAAAQRIGQWAAEHPEQAAAALAAITDAALAQANKPGDAAERINALYQLAITAPTSPAGMQAMRDATAQLQQGETRQFARAELLLKRMAETGDAAGATSEAEAKALLAKMYEQRHWPAAEDAAANAAPLMLPESQLRVLWRNPTPETRVLSLGNGDELDDDAFLASHVVMYVPSWRRLVCRDAQSGEATWSVQLPANANQMVMQNGLARQFTGVRQGHVLVLTYAESMQAIDLADGAVLWTINRGLAQPKENTARIRFNQGGFFQPGQPSRDLLRRMDMGRGVVLSLDMIDQQPTVSAIDLFTGRALWQRTSEEHMLTGVAMAGGQAVVVMDQGQTLWIGDPATGRTVRTITLPITNANMQSVWLDDGLLYQTVTGKLAYQSVSDDGRHWEIGGEGRQRYPQRINRLNDHLSLVMWSGGQLDLIETPGGKVKWSVETTTMGNNILDSALSPDGQRLVVLGFDNSRRFTARFVNVADGRPLCNIPMGRSLNNNMRISARAMASAGPVVPYLDVEDNEGTRALRFYRAADGKLLDMAIHGENLDNLFGELIQPPVVRNHTLIVTTRGATYAFGIKPGEKGEPVGVIETPVSDAGDDGAGTTTTVNGMTIRVRDGKVELQTPGGGTIRAGDININQNGQKIEVKTVNGKTEVRVNGKLVEPDKKPDDKNQPAPENNPAPPPAPQPAPQK